MNPIVKGIPNINMGQFRQMFNTIRSMKNPQYMLNQMIANNPNSQAILNYLKQFNGDYEAAFKAKAQEMGVDINDFLNNFK